MPSKEPTSDLKAEARRAAEDIGREAADAVEAVKHRGAEFVGAARSRGSEYAEHARDEARRIYREGERHAADAAAHAEEYYDELTAMVRRNPAQALGIAAGVGFLVGLIVATRR